MVSSSLERDRPVLEIRGLERRFGDDVVIRDLDLVLQRGERLIVRGPNGSGKTTLLRCIAGVLTPTSGRISLGGHPAGSLAARFRCGASLSQERAFVVLFFSDP